MPEQLQLIFVNRAFKGQLFFFCSCSGGVSLDFRVMNRKNNMLKVTGTRFLTQGTNGTNLVILAKVMAQLLLK